MDGSDTLRFIHDDSEEIVGFIKNDSGIYLYIKNIFGDIIGIVDENGSVVVEYEYDVWGKLVSVSGSLAETLGQLNPIRYRGYYYDSESGYYYLQSRYYDPELRRFINADKLENLYSPKNTYLYADSVNTFAYCTNSPVNMVDYSGEKEKNNTSNYLANVLVFSLCLLQYNDYIGIYSDKKYATNKNIYNKSKKGAIAISMERAFNDINLKQTFSRFLFDFYFTLGDKIFDAIATFAMDKFKTDFPQKHYDAYAKKISPRPFLFSKSCVSYEIKLHCLVHWIATGSMIITYASPVYYLYVVAGIYLRGYTKVIEIAEQDVLKPRDENLFDYYSGIAKCYRKTAADPYWNGKKRDENYFKSSWKTKIIPYKASK